MRTACGRPSAWRAPVRAGGGESDILRRLALAGARAATSLPNHTNGANPWLLSATSAARGRASATGSPTRTAAPLAAGIPTSRWCTPRSTGRPSACTCARPASRPGRSPAEATAPPAVIRRRGLPRRPSARPGRTTLTGPEGPRSPARPGGTTLTRLGSVRSPGPKVHVHEARPLAGSPAHPQAGSLSGSPASGLLSPA